ncbi:IS66 family transposase [Zavarzinella formosa]|uniref:IS66 family transposase n=1 Tax=Zavarzinella formosa TaxID=360055 RepID=UPI0002DA96DC|nr:IS66 family transposase [Zavarzinella formosa]
MDVPKLTPEMLAGFPPSAVELIQQLLAVIQLQAAKIAELEEKLSQNSHNSSKPPSSDGLAVKPSPPKSATGKKPGGQPGHSKQSRTLIPTVECHRMIPCFPAVRRNCSKPLAGNDPNPLRFQVTELPPVKPEVTEYQRHRLVCACGFSNCGPLPTGVTGQDGPRLRAWVVLLTGRYRMSKENAANLTGDVFGVSLSAGQVCSVEAGAGRMLQPVADEILAAARRSASNIDETSMGRGRWLWVMVTAVGTAFQIVTGRNREELLNLIGDNDVRVLTSDRHSLYSRLWSGQHQLCWAHLRRDFQAMIDRNNDGSEVGRELLMLSDELFGLWKRVRDGTLTKKAFASKMTRPGVFRTRLDAALKQGLAGGCAKTRGTCGQLIEREASLFRFAFNDGVEPTNNAAERAIRHGVIWRKQSHGPKSESGAAYLANIWSVVETCRQQGRRVWDFLAECFNAAQTGQPLPRLVTPVPQLQAA